MVIAGHAYQGFYNKNPASVWMIVGNGVISYSLYLWQEPFLKAAHFGAFTRLPFNIAMTFLAAELSYRVVERPLLAYRDRFMKRSARQIAPASEAQLAL